MAVKEKEVPPTLPKCKKCGKVLLHCKCEDSDLRK